MRKFLLTALTAAALNTLAPSAQAAPTALGVDFTGGTVYGVGGYNNVGWSFNVSTSITIDGLGLFDAGADGLNNRHQVGLWRTDGTLLAQATVFSGSTAVASAAGGLGQWLFADIGALTLDTGDYVLGAFFADDDSDLVIASASGLTAASGLTYVSSLASDAATLAMPGTYGLVEPGVFGPNLRLAEATVPEPASLALVSLALMASFVRRRR